MDNILAKDKRFNTGEKFYMKFGMGDFVTISDKFIVQNVTEAKTRYGELNYSYHDRFLKKGLDIQTFFVRNNSMCLKYVDGSMFVTDFSKAKINNGLINASFSRLQSSQKQSPLLNVN
ncbi:MAG: hypothetical protein IPH43_15685 [Xanthomonadales bacterium]|nr:hypothetical protein [Xanthomonadales bacterium]